MKLEFLDHTFDAFLTVVTHVGGQGGAAPRITLTVKPPRSPQTSVWAIPLSYRMIRV